MWKLLAGFLTVCTLACSTVPETGTLSSMLSKVYAGMDEEERVVANLVRGSSFTILGEETDAEGEKWLHIRTAFGTEGYILSSDASRESEGTGGNTGLADDGQIRASGNANIRESASLDAAVIGQVPDGTLLEPLEVYENENGEVWYRVAYGEFYGYISEAAVTKGNVEGWEVGAGETESETGQEAGNEEDGINSDGLPEESQDAGTEVETPQEGGGETGTETPNTGQPKPGEGEDASRPATGENGDTPQSMKEPESVQDSESEIISSADGQEDSGLDGSNPDSADRKKNIPMDGTAALIVAGIVTSILAIVYIIIMIRRELRGLPIKGFGKSGMGKDREINAAGRNGQEPREGVPQNRKPGRGGTD